MSLTISDKHVLDHILVEYSHQTSVKFNKTLMM